MKSNHCALFGPITNQARRGKVRTMHDVIVPILIPGKHYAE